MLSFSRPEPRGIMNRLVLTRGSLVGLALLLLLLHPRRRLSTNCWPAQPAQHDFELPSMRCPDWTASVPKLSDSEHPGHEDQGPPDLDAGSDHLDSVKGDLVLDCNKGNLPADSNRNEQGASQDELRRLKRLICPCPCFLGGVGGPGKQLTLRAYLCVDAVGAVKPGRPRETLDRTALKMQVAIRRAGEDSADASPQVEAPRQAR